MSKFSRLASAAIFTTLLVFTAALADTILPGGEIQDSVWPVSGSPYRVQGTITLPGDGSLTIEPGVEVLFEGNYQFVIEGRLTASGTESDSILFAATSSLLGWGGLRFINAQVYSRLDYCRFELGWAQGPWPENCGGAIYLYGSIQAITHCSFVNNRAEYDGGAIFLWGGAPIFSHNLFTDNLSANGNGHALYLGDCEGLVLNHLTVVNNGSGSGYSLFMANDGTNFVMTNSVLWDSYQFFAFEPGSITYNCIDPAYVLDEDSLLVFGTGNLGGGDFDPYFIDLASGDLRVEQYSQTIDAASPSSPYSAEPEPNGGRANQGAYGNSPLAAISLPLLSFTADSLNLDAPSFDFGSQKILTTPLVETFSIYNVGRLPLVLDSLIFSNDQFSGSLFAPIDPVYGEVAVAPDTSVLCSLLFLPTAIDSVEGIMSFLDNDTTSDPTISLSGIGVNPVIELIPDTLHFEETNVGETSDTLWLGIKNAGQDSAGIESDLYLYTFQTSDNFVILNPDTNASNPTQILDTIKVDSTRYYPVIFTPTDRLDFAENVTVGSRNAGSAFLHATGTGSQPVLEFDTAQDSLLFSVVTIGQEATQEITLGNSGPIDLVISRPNLIDSINYSFDFLGSEITIPPGGEATIPITFHPTTSGLHNTTLQIPTNEPTLRGSSGWQYRTVTVWLFGTGTSQVNWVIGATTGLWEAANSPYYMVGDVNVPANGELVIEPGVEVLLEGDFEFTVYGTLEANGTSTAPITFTTIDPAGRWTGLTFQQGSSASVLNYCEFYRGENPFGGVLRIINSSPSLNQCEFYDNTAAGGQGGAVAIDNDSEPAFSACQFHDNSAGSGGALYAGWFTKPHIENCDFYDNTAVNGGALYIAGALGSISNCEIYTNTAVLSMIGTTPNLSTGLGGGVYLNDGAATEMFGNKIHDNQAANGGGVAIVWFTKPFIHDEAIYGNNAFISDASYLGNGGGLFLQNGCGPVILKTIVAENTAEGTQGVHLQGSGAVINYCTFVAEATDTLPAGWLLNATLGDQSMISNSILWGSSSVSNSAPVNAASSSLAVTYSDVAGAGFYPGLNNVNDDPLFVNTGDIWQRYALQDSSALMDKSETGAQIGALGGSSSLAWDVTLSVVQHPVQIYQEYFTLTSTIPLLSPPYVYIETNYFDTVGYAPSDSAFMVAIAPMIYRLPVGQNGYGLPSRMTITISNILGQDSTLLQGYTGAPLAGSGSSELQFASGLDEIRAVARSASGAGFWGLMPETYANPKPLDAERVAIGQAYQVFANVDEFADGQVEFALSSELLNGAAASGCAVARWNGENWVVLPSYLNAAGTVVRADLSQQGSYRLVWGEDIKTATLPENLELYQNYPNPFNPETAISFALPEAGQVTLEVFDLMGRRVADLAQGRFEAGVHRVVWNAASVASGIYFYRLQIGGRQLTKKMILVR